MARTPNWTAPASEAMSRKACETARLRWKSRARPGGARAQTLQCGGDEPAAKRKNVEQDAPSFRSYSATIPWLNHLTGLGHREYISQQAGGLYRTRTGSPEATSPSTRARYSASARQPRTGRPGSSRAARPRLGAAWSRPPDARAPRAPAGTGPDRRCARCPAHARRQSSRIRHACHFAVGAHESRRSRPQACDQPYGPGRPTPRCGQCEPARRRASPAGKDMPGVTRSSARRRAQPRCGWCGRARARNAGADAPACVDADRESGVVRRRLSWSSWGGASWPLFLRRLPGR